MAVDVDLKSATSIVRVLPSKPHSSAGDAGTTENDATRAESSPALTFIAPASRALTSTPPMTTMGAQRTERAPAENTRGLTTEIARPTAAWPVASTVGPPPEPLPLPPASKAESKAESKADMSGDAGVKLRCDVHSYTKKRIGTKIRPNVITHNAELIH